MSSNISNHRVEFDGFLRGPLSFLEEINVPVDEAARLSRVPPRKLMLWVEEGYLTSRSDEKYAFRWREVQKAYLMAMLRNESSSLEEAAEKAGQMLADSDKRYGNVAVTAEFSLARTKETVGKVVRKLFHDRQVRDLVTEKLIKSLIEIDDRKRYCGISDESKSIKTIFAHKIPNGRVYDIEICPGTMAEDIFEALNLPGFQLRRLNRDDTGSILGSIFGPNEDVYTAVKEGEKLLLVPVAQ